MPAGRPLKWKDPDQLQEMIDKYFEETPEEEWTVTGLALSLDTYRSMLIDYEQKGDEFCYAIKRAKEKVHNAYEKDLRKKGRAGDIFALKNFGWSDKQEIDHTSGGKPLNALAELPPEKRAIVEQMFEEEKRKQLTSSKPE